MVPWFHGSMVPWFNGSMVQWFNGSMDPPLTQKEMAGKKDSQRGKGRLSVINKVQSMLIYI